jgi:predicted secreted protein
MLGITKTWLGVHNAKFLSFHDTLFGKGDLMVNRDRMLALGMILTILALHIGASLANINGCNLIGIHEVMGKSISDDTLKVMSATDNESLAQKAINAFRSLIGEPSNDDVIDEERLGADDTMHAKLNEPFNISLDSNPTTGYSWTVDFDHEYLSGGTEVYSTSNTSQPISVGGGSKQIFNFTPIQEGRTIISAVYKRPWEDTAAEKRTFLIVISTK